MLLIAKEVGEKLLRRKWSLATAESCTGGLVATLITDVAGSSQWFDRGFITYSNASKMQMLGVLPATLNDYGAVSLNTVEEMASGAISQSDANCSIAISGIAGPSGGSDTKPVGSVCIAWQTLSCSVVSECCLFVGDREQIREKAAIYSLQKLSLLLSVE